MKACSIKQVAQLVAKFVSGFSCSSIFEAKFARNLVSGAQTVQFVGPGIQAEEFTTLCETADYLTFNSLEQVRRFIAQKGKVCSFGLRINPEISFYPNEKFDPCRRNSRLGVPLSTVEESDDVWKGLSGIHLHSNAISKNTNELFETVRRVVAKFGNVLPNLKWINLGGGYLFHNTCDLTGLERTMDLLHSKYNLDVYIEPGAGVTGSSGRMVAKVIDKFSIHGVTHLILDTTAYHVPAAFDGQLTIDGSSASGEYKYLIGGVSCLAGDVFGQYAFEKPFGIGDTITFPHTGAYSAVKWHMFNGIRPPSIYFSNLGGELSLLKSYSFTDFLAHQGSTIDLPRSGDANEYMESLRETL